VQFRVLGPLEVDAGDGPIPLGGPKQRAVLANLLIRANQLVPSETLIGEIWGEEPPERARHTLQTYVSNLRRTIGEDRLQGRSPGYILLVDPLDLDAARFDSLVRDAKEALPVAPTVAVATLEDALALWRGPALADLAERSSLLAEAARLDDLRLDAQESRIEGLLASGAQAAAIGELEPLLTAHPLREGLWGQLMTALYREGRQAEALSAFQRAREILADELGIDPSPELTRLHERILKQDPGLDLRGEPLRGYRLLERIDDGPTGTEFRAIQPRVGRDVAIRVIHEHIASDPAFVARFEAEAQAVAALEHPHIAPIHDYWREPGRAYIVSRYLRGGSLRGIEERVGSIQRDLAIRIVEQVASALAFAHRHGIAHGNLGASNVLLDAEGNAYVVDFRVGIGPAPEPGQDVHALAVLTASLLGPAAPPRLQELMDRADADAGAPTADEFAGAARSSLEPDTARAPEPKDLRNPYKGIRAFTSADARDFFGRGELTERLVARLNEPGPVGRFLAVVGPSGSGKSSVVNAGLVPAIRRGALGEERASWVAEMFPGPHPIDEVSAALLRVSTSPAPRLHDVVDGGTRGLLDAVELVTSGDSQIVLVVDQFEELFTLTTNDRERELFLEGIRVATADPRSRLRVIVTLRADFYDRPLVYPRFGELLAARTEAVPPMTPDELEQAIRAPAEQEGVWPEPGLVAEMIADVAHQPGGLPLLQYALTELFERREGDRLTLDAYHAIGGVAGALSAKAERTYASADADGRRAIRQVFLRLVTLGEGRQDTRRRVMRRELDDLDVDPAQVDAVLDTFGHFRLLTFDREPATREPTVEIAHEALLGAWTRMRGWTDRARDDLRQERRLARAGAEWRGSDEDPSFLLRGARLEQAEAWASATDLAIGRHERSYLKASVDERDRERSAEHERRDHEAQVERRARTRLRALVVVFAAAALVAGTLTIIATNESDEAARQATIATARGLAAAAVANLQTDPERSILLAMEAIDRTRSVDGSVLPEASEALHQAVTTSRVVMSVPGIGGAVAWSARGVFVTEGPQGTGMVDIRDADSGASALPPFRGHDGDITDVAFSTDGSKLATTGDDGALNVWNPATGELMRSASYQGDVRAPSFSRDGELVAGVWGSTIRIMDLADGNVIQTIRLTDLAGVTGTVDAALSGDGEAIALEVGGGGVIVEVATSDISVRLRGSSLVGALAWSPDDRSIATVGSSGVVEIYDSTTGDLRNELWGQRSFVWSVAWNTDGSQIVTGGAEGAAQVWNVSETEGRELFSLKSLEMAGGIGGVAFSPDGNRVMAGAADRSAVKVWDVSPTGDREWANIPARSFLGDVEFMPGGDRVVVPTARDAAAIWQIDPARKVRTIGIPGHIHFPGSGNPRVSVSPEGGSILLDGGDRDGGPGMLAAYDTTAGKVLFREAAQGLSADAWSADGSLIALAKGGSVRILDRSGREVARLREEGDDHRVVAAAFSPDGSRLATSVALSASDDGGFLQVWDWASGRIVREVELRPGGELVFDRSGDRLVLFDGRFVETWDIRSGARNTVRVNDTASLGGFALSPEGTRIAVSSQTGPIRLMDANTGDVLTVLHGHSGLVAALAFSADSSKLASTTVSTVPIGGNTRIWALDIDDLLAIAHENVTRELTDEECQRYLHVESCPP
jgi:WD40 repeat protein/DNA-binding SARP family transcriptional activator